MIFIFIFPARLLLIFNISGKYFVIFELFHGDSFSKAFALLCRYYSSIYIMDDDALYVIHISFANNVCIYLVIRFTFPC